MTGRPPPADPDAPSEVAPDAEMGSAPTAPHPRIAARAAPVALSPTIPDSDRSGATTLAERPSPPATAPSPQAPRAREDRLVGVTLSGRYQVTRKLGEGGMGAVYEARHTLIGKRMAVKVLLEKYADKPDVVARLQQEARLASSIGHPHIVDITDFGQTDDGHTFVVMEFLEGESLAALLRREGPMPPDRAIAIARQISDALGAAHGKGILHRDVKPENVFIVPRGGRDFVKVVDFGISKSIRGDEDDPDTSPRLTRTGMVLGTPLYMSPEQARGEEDLDHRIDVYALGVILYELLTGEVPFHASNYLGIISQVLTATPRRPRELRPDLEITEALERVVVKAMEKDRTRRYGSMAEIEADLARLERGELDVALGATASAQVRRARPRSFAVGALVGAAALLLVAGAVVGALRLGGRAADRGAAPPRASAAPARAPAQRALPLAPAPPAAADVALTLESTPPGAMVLDGETELGRTPHELRRPRGWAGRLAFRLEGYRGAVEPVLPLEGDATVRVQLERDATRRRRGAARPGDPASLQHPPDRSGKVNELTGNPYP